MDEEHRIDELLESISNNEKYNGCIFWGLISTLLSTMGLCGKFRMTQIVLPEAVGFRTLCPALPSTKASV